MQNKGQVGILILAVRVINYLHSSVGRSYHIDTKVCQCVE